MKLCTQTLKELAWDEKTCFFFALFLIYESSMKFKCQVVRIFLISPRGVILGHPSSRGYQPKQLFCS